MKRTILFLALMALVVGMGWSSAKIFYVNLYNEPVDVRLGESSGYAFKMDGLKEYTSTYMIESSDYGTYKLYFKKSEDKKWYFFANDDKEAINCEVESGKVHCIVIGVDGTVEYYTMSDVSGSKPKVMFINGTDEVMPRMEIGTSWMKEFVAFAADMEIYCPYGVVAVAPGDYSLYWQFKRQKSKGTYYYYPDNSGENPEVFSFEKGKYYLFLSYTKKKTDYGILYDVTPQ